MLRRQTLTPSFNLPIAPAFISLYFVNMLPPNILTTEINLPFYLYQILGKRQTYDKDIFDSWMQSIHLEHLLDAELLLIDAFFVINLG